MKPDFKRLNKSIKDLSDFLSSLELVNTSDVPQLEKVEAHIKNVLEDFRCEVSRSFGTKLDKVVATYPRELRGVSALSYLAKNGQKDIVNAILTGELITAAGQVIKPGDGTKVPIVLSLKILGGKWRPVTEEISEETPEEKTEENAA